ncbi:MAG: hypothetical protein GXY42_05785 [Desulfovibrionales bacterium]|nr:hypothetical protein [Desulfovibrionales bacterium]
MNIVSQIHLFSVKSTPRHVQGIGSAGARRSMGAACMTGGLKKSAQALGTRRISMQVRCFAFLLSRKQDIIHDCMYNFMVEKNVRNKSIIRLADAMRNSGFSITGECYDKDTEKYSDNLIDYALSSETNLKQVMGISNIASLIAIPVPHGGISIAKMAKAACRVRDTLKSEFGYQAEDKSRGGMPARKSADRAV